MRALVQLAIVGIVAYLMLRLVQLWRDDALDLSSANVSLLVLAGAASLLSIVAYGLVWPLLLRALGAPVPGDALAIFLQSQLGKYIPGGVWHYAGRVALARARGVPARLGVASLGVEIAASATAAAIVAAFVLHVLVALPLAILVGLVVATPRLVPGLSGRVTGLAARLVGRVYPAAGVDVRPAFGALPHATALYLPVFVVYGIAFWLTGRAFVPIPASDFVYYSAVFALGWLTGMVVVFAPGGIGVREAVLVAFLGPKVGHGEAIVIAGTSRVLLTSADVVAGTAAIGLARWRALRPAALVDRGST